MHPHAKIRDGIEKLMSATRVLGLHDDVSEGDRMLVGTALEAGGQALDTLDTLRPDPVDAIEVDATAFGLDQNGNPVEVTVKLKSDYVRDLEAVADAAAKVVTGLPPGIEDVDHLIDALAKLTG
jgi:hypothetical protein